MPWRRTRLADLIQVREERKRLLVLACPVVLTCLIDQRFAAAQRRA
jgi:hypothetical protein